MNARTGTRRRRASILAWLAVFSLFVAVFPGWGQTGRGATVIVTTKQGSQTAGELIAVRASSLLLLEPSGKDLGVDMAEVRSVLVLRRSKAAGGAVMGLLAGAVGGYAGGAIYAKSAGLCPGCEAPYARIGWGVLGGIAGLVGGVIVGASAGHDLLITLDDPGSAAFQPGLKKLRKYARIANPQ